MKYENYDVWDFVEDDYFLSWVKDSDSEAEKFWNKWLSHHPHKSDEIGLARSIVTRMAYADNDKPSEKEAIEMFESIIKGRQKISSAKLIPLPVSLMKYAALLILGIGLVAFYWYSNDITIPSSYPVKSNMIEKVNPKGMKSTIWLSDGTKVRLNAESIITYPERFSDTMRIVTLEGEAFFEVKRNISKPFIVYSNGVQTEVLGTSFNVKAYKDEFTIEVGVTEGMVRVSGSEFGVISEMDLLPKQKSIFDLQGKKVEKVTFNPEEDLAWRDWILKFERESLDEIFHQIERWYAVEIQIGSTIDLNQSYSGVFENEPLDAVLKVLGHNADFSFTINENNVLIN